MTETNIEMKEAGQSLKFSTSDSSEIANSFGLYDVDIDSSFFETDSICFSLNRDIYNFCALLYERNLFAKMKQSHKIGLVLLATFSWIVQTSTVLFMQAMTYNYFGISDIQGILTCTNTNFYDNDCLFVESNENYDSEFFTDGKPKYRSSIYNVARCISISIVLCYVYSTIASITSYSVMISISSNKYKRSIWVFIVLSQILFIFVAIQKIIVFTFYQEKIIDILSVGLSFIILVEIDDVLYKSVKDMTPLKDPSKLFKFKIKKTKFKRLTIYHKCDNYVYDGIFFAVLFICSLFFMIVMLWYIPKWTDFWYNYFGWMVFAPIAILFVLPYIIMCFESKQYKNQH